MQFPPLEALGGPRKDHMRNAGCCHVPDAAIPKLHRVETSEQAFAGTEQDRSDGQMHLVHESRAQVLLDRRDTTAQPDVASLRSLGRALQRGVYAASDKVKAS